MEVPKGVGIGVKPKMDLIDKYTVKKLIFKA
jgi:hypothetical protein